MKYRLVCLLLLCFVAEISYAQELTKKKKNKGGITQEYYVLKADKNMKYGESLTTFKDILNNQFLIEYGYYKYGIKDGVWLTFYYSNPSNFLKSAGEYRNGKREGNWRYYYPGLSNGKSLQTLLGAEKRTSAISGKDGFIVAFDSTGQQIVCSGKYSEDKKVGVWSYYSRSGYLIHQFDHSSKEFVLNRLREEDNDFLAFLGGPERFYNSYHTLQFEIKMKSPISKSSEVVYEVDQNGTYKFIHAHGDEKFKEQVEQVLSEIPNDWVWLDAESNKKLQIVSKVLYNPDSFNRYQFSLDLNVVTP
ncbi:hypothetical protein LVD17_28080 [Fulvivirga ulvae]|uniref:hypothetical protein n=1 Tax=Fulvivirga ulvae TaxID=2904245 RepID=UPI001F2F4C53|nr:hypothetical protein [Fulvivirga ulvae]UII32147.1 hypothetical protein LVD17_28080 [Fulvivirga ulvae]